jgi:lysophospholipase L1-like esterase
VNGVKALRKLAGPLLVVLLGASILGLVVTFGFAKRFYRELNAVKLDPLGAAGLEVDASKSRPKLAIYGDSRAAEWPEPPGLAEAAVLNLGIDGQTSAQVLARFDAHLGPIDPEIVLLQVGINDLKTIPLFPEDRDQIVANIKDNIRQIVERCRGKGARVVVTTIFPVAEIPLERKLFWSDEVEVAIDEVNAYLETLASEQVEIVATAGILAGDDGRTDSEYSRDFLHLNAAGYERLNAELGKLMNDLKAPAD